MFHPVDTRELVTRLVVNFVPSGTGVGKAGGSSASSFSLLFFGCGTFFFPSPFSLAIVPCFLGRSNPLSLTEQAERP